MVLELPVNRAVTWRFVLGISELKHIFVLGERGGGGDSNNAENITFDRIKV